MTEIPEHLLKRSRERREALGLAQPGDAPAVEVPATESTAVEVAGETAPAPAAASRAPATAPPPPPPPKPPPPHVQAAFDRKRIPWWAMPVLAGLPIWAFIFAFTLEPPSRGANDPLTLGKELYDGACASCHGTGGGGGAGPALTGGAVTETWPNWRNQIAWVRHGSATWPLDSYGAQEKSFTGGMPQFGEDLGGTLTDGEIALIVRYEREVLGGGDPEEDLVALTEAVAEESEVTLEGAPVEEILAEAAEPGDGPGGTSDPPQPG